MTMLVLLVLLVLIYTRLANEKTLQIKHDILQVGVQTVTPHALGGIIHALLSRLARSFHRHAAGRAGASASASSATLHAGRSVAPSSLVKESLYPEARLLADDVGVVRGGDEADGLGGACVEVTGGVYALLDGVGSEGALVVDDDVVRRADGALEARVRLQVEVKVY